MILVLYIDYKRPIAREGTLCVCVCVCVGGGGGWCVMYRLDNENSSTKLKKVST